MSVIIYARDLVKNFVSQTGGGKVTRALNGISLDVEEGEILGVLGPNGAGKTTFINVLATLLIPDGGCFEIAGIKGRYRNFSRIRQRINLSSGYPNFPWSLTVRENLIFYGRLYNIPSRKLKEKIDTLLEQFDLGANADRRFDELSSGTKQRLSLAKAFLNDPSVLFLDEPTVGLDPEATVRIRRMVLETIQQRRMTVLLTTHNMAEAEMMCRRVAFIKAGQIIRLASPGELKSLQRKNNLEEVFIELSRAGGAEPRVEIPNPEQAVARKQSAITAGSAAPMGRGQLAAGFARGGLIGWFRRALAFTYRNYLFAVRNFFAFAEMLFWPGVTLLSIGLMGDFLTLGPAALTFILTGAIVGGVLQVVQLDVSYSLLYDVWSKSMKHTFIAPLEMGENIFGSWLVGIVRGLVVFALLSAAAVVLFNFHFPALHVTLIFLAGIFTTAILLGSVVSFLVLLFGQKAEISAWMFAYLVMLLAGIYYPVSTLPPFFYSLAQWVPVTYFLEYYRASIGFPATFSHVLLKGFGLVIFYLFVGHFLLKFALLHARRKGIIVRVSE